MRGHARQWDVAYSVGRFSLHMQIHISPLSVGNVAVRYNDSDRPVGRKERLLFHDAVSAATNSVPPVPTNDPIATLLEQRSTLIGRLEQEREQLGQLRAIVEGLEERVTYDERLLSEIESVLGNVPQLSIEDANVRLRGRRLEEVALQVLAEERGEQAEVHYKEWFNLLRERGLLVAGKEPLNTFLAQINRSGAVEKVGHRTGLYRLAS